MKIAILGALGFLGKNLTQSLVSQGHHVTGFVLNPPTAQPTGFEYSPLSTLYNVPLTERIAFDVVINLAARRSTRNTPLSDAEVREFTFDIPKDFILRASGPETLILNASTYIQNFGGIEGQTVDSYGSAKQELSEYLQEISTDQKFRVLDLFLFTIFGQGDRPNHLVPSLLSAAKKGDEISLSPGHQLMNLIYIDDVVRNFSKTLSITDEFSYRKHYMWREDYFSVRELVSSIESIANTSINCVWGGRQYAGHEMFEPWSIPMTQFPGFEEHVTLEEGLQKLWSALPN